MIQQKIASTGRREISHPAVDSTLTLRYLIRIRHVNLAALSNSRRPQGQFPATYERSINRKWKENIRITDITMVEIISRSGTKSVDIQKPTFIRDGHTE